LVKDNGIGIPEDMCEKIFDRFFHDVTTMPRINIAQEGTGVGLALTKSLVELHKGNISVVSYPDSGSVFKVVLPSQMEVYREDIVEDEFIVKTDRISKKVINEIQSSQDYHSETADDKNGGNKNGANYTVLVVDDNSEVCNLIKDLLIDDYDVQVAHNGVEALDIVDVERVDLIISDVIMPQMNGLELCSKIKMDINRCHIPVILLTAKGELEQRIEGIQAGADSYIPKPFHPYHLLVRIKKLLEVKERFRNAYKGYGEDSQSDLLEGLSEKDQKLLTTLDSYIEDNLEDSLLDADHLSEHLVMSKTQLYRKIKALTGYTPHGLIKHVRMKNAALLLQGGEKTVLEVFYETGFNNRTYFYRSFKDAFGVTPGEYGKLK
jgi:DNA-binding response OmpR family regulator